MKETNKIIAESAARASAEAVKRAKLANVPVTYLSGTDIVKEYSDGRCETLSQIPAKNASTVRRFKLS